ncbi:R3H and coiled-coil domain-containing protein 1 [Clupea harengus]|uniref:R3H and coiled-coil domain-containing protein 1 n=1 Tax=Clupea harengus TaxID=7950 RepID=A0A8M1KN82_CLUHA|nr:R3H and coiled-coil domain-containing protein 1 [Clupea harengus]XP_042565338.1 R3H and coiled-coil domain-containing protein 1 [Clupea harengus]XP_042565339.1 R3H and coiled-coil domain-containing protein 1 [Clupea harengus]
MENSRGRGGGAEHRRSRGRGGGGGGGGGRRPDKAIYVPRAMRERGATPQGVVSPPKDCAERVPSSAESVPSSAERVPSSAERVPSEESCSDTADSQPATANQRLGLDPLDESGGQEMFVQLSASEPCPWPPAWDQTVSYFVSMSLDDQAEAEEEEEEEEEEEDDESAKSTSSTGVPPSSASSSRDSEAGDCTQEIISKLTEEDVSIEHAQNDYSSFENVWINDEEFSHVIEIYNFPAMFKDEDLLDAFSAYSGGGMKIKWVDDTHALGVFSSETAAAEALSITHPLLKTRPLAQASRKSKGKAVRRAEFIQPVKERPRTDTAVARRMVTRALGLQRGGLRGKRC